MTNYSSVYNFFLGKITDYKLPQLDDATKEYNLHQYLVSACIDFNITCEIDLSDRDDTSGAFNNDLSDQMIDILAEIMVVKWLTPYLNTTELLENALNTSDFNSYSPANLLSQIRQTHAYSSGHVKALINNYSFRKADPLDLI